MTARAGVLRRGVELDAAAAQLAGWAAVVRPGTVADSLDPRAHEDLNLLLAAGLLVEAARNRTASVGAHHRADTDQPSAPTFSMQRISS